MATPALPVNLATLETKAKYMTKMDAESGEHRTSFFAIFAVLNSAELIFFIYNLKSQE